jgi:glycosyltransferase involved in cell wall biosynthesis
MISILLPAKNQEPFLKECLDSIQIQTFTKWEVILVNDHSTDRTVEIAIGHPIARSGKLYIVDNEGDGLLDALLTGWKHVKGDYITRMDGDDLMSVDRLQLMKNALDSCQNPSLVTGWVQYFPRHLISEGYKRYEQWLNDRQIYQDHHLMIYRECVFASPNWMMKTEELKAIGDFDELTYPEDYALALKCYAKGVKFVGLPHHTLSWRHHPLRMSIHHEGYDQSSFFRLKITEFIKNEYDPSKNIVVWGENEKSRLTGILLKELEVPYISLNLKNVHRTKKICNPLILIAVYPDISERNEIRKYLGDLKLDEGQHYWFL